MGRVRGSLLERARAGDEQAFSTLMDPYLRELHLHCYRMLGSLADAEDLLQDSLLAAWRGLGDFAGRSSIRTWLYRIATNRCLNAIRDRRRRPRTEPVPPFTPPEPSRRSGVSWLDPYPDAWLEHHADATAGPAQRYEARAGVELAFITALQRLPPRQTAAVILVDVLGFSAAETAEMLDCRPTAVKGVLQRARAELARTSSGNGHAPTGGACSPIETRLARRFAAAFTAGDIDGVVALLTDDSWLAMPPAPHEYVGAEAIAGFLCASFDWRLGRDLGLQPTRANGQPAFICTLNGRTDSIAHPAGMVVLTVLRDRITAITRFLDAELAGRFQTRQPAVGGLARPPLRD